MIGAIRPHHRIEIEYEPVDPEIYAKWGPAYDDPRLIQFMTTKMAAIFMEEQEVAKQSMKDATVPLLFIEAQNEEVVSN